MTTQRLASTLALALLAAAAFILGATLSITAPGLTEAAERARNIERWLDEGCSTDADCEAMERTIGPDHQSK